MSLRHYVIVTLLLTAALLPHISTLNAQFTYDDRVYVVANPGIRSFRKAVASFAQTWPPNDNMNRSLYRPMAQLSYALDFALGRGANPTVFHAMNLFLYWLTMFLVFFVAHYYLKSWPYALCIALLFACHPIHCEVVDSVTGRTEMLALFFGLLCWHNFLKFEQTQKLWRLFASGMFYAMAATSKETGVMFAPLLVAHVWFHPLLNSTNASLTERNAHQKKRWLGILGIMCIAPIYLVARHVALSGKFVPGHPILGESPLAHRIWSIGRVFTEYFRLLLAPTTLQIDPYYSVKVGIVTKPTIASLFGLLLLFLMLFYLALHLRRPTEAVVEIPTETSTPHKGTVPFFVACFLLLYFPVSQLIPIGTIMAERLLYSASLPFIFLVVLGAHYILNHNKANRVLFIGMIVLFVSVVVLFSVRSGFRALEWKTPISLWESAAAQASHHSIHQNLATTYLKRKQYGLAEKHFRSAAKLLPRKAFASWYNLGLLAEKKHKYSQAIGFYKFALRIRPNEPYAKRQMLHCLAKLNKAKQMVQKFRRELNTTHNVLLLQKLGGACVIIEDYRCARTAVRRISQLNRRNKECGTIAVVSALLCDRDCASGR